MAVTKVGVKYQVTIPKVAREAAGLKVGDIVEATSIKEGVLLRPKVLVDRHPGIDARLREAEADVKAGRVHGPFKTTRAMVQSLHRTAPKKKAKRQR